MAEQPSKRRLLAYDLQLQAERDGYNPQKYGIHQFLELADAFLEMDRIVEEQERGK